MIPFKNNPSWQRQETARTAARLDERTLVQYAGRHGTLASWTEGDGGEQDRQGRAYVGQPFVCIRVELHRIRQTSIPLVYAQFGDGKRLYAHLWDVEFYEGLGA